MTLIVRRLSPTLHNSILQHGFRYSEVPVGCILRGVGADVVVELHDCLTTELSEKVERV